MINKETYKRLTRRNQKGFPTYNCSDEDIKDCELYYNCGECYKSTQVIKRLAELEDKIESGLLVELPFAVIDKQTKKEADEYKIALEEDWAKDLCYCDMDGFAITQDGNIILLDECGKYTYCPYDRFEIIAEARLKELQEYKK